MSIGINHTRGDTPGEEGRQDTHRAAQASRAGDRGAADFLAHRSRSDRFYRRYRADIRPISADMHGVFIADIRVQIGLRSEIPVIGPI